MKLLIVITVVFLLLSFFIFVKLKNKSKKENVLKFFDVLKKDCSNKTIIITGSSEGIGKYAASIFGKLNANVIFACRNKLKTEKVIEKIKEQCRNWGNEKVKLQFVHLDLVDMNCIVKFCNEIMQMKIKIDILICNAGIGGVSQGCTKQGFDICFGVNYLGHYLLTRLLMKKIIESNTRIIFTSSLMHSWLTIDQLMTDKYVPFVGKIKNDIGFPSKILTTNIKAFLNSISQSAIAYSRSKLAMTIFSKILQKKLSKIQNCEVISVSFNPGVVNTAMNKILKKKLGSFRYKLIELFMVSIEEGTKLLLHLSLCDEKELKKGGYFSGNSEIEVTKTLSNETTQEWIWEKSERLIRKHFDENIKLMKL